MIRPLTSNAVQTNPEILKAVYRRLLAQFGRVHWWPARSACEIAIGAILTQRTTWRNVELALTNLRRAGVLTPQRLARVKLAQLQRWIRPAGFYRQKAPRVRAFARYLVKHHAGRLVRWLQGPVPPVRQELLGLPGIGPETADTILLYAGGRPVLVVDAYTQRILVRHGWVTSRISYQALQRFCEDGLPRRVRVYELFHALLVEVGKRYCRMQPHCRRCPLNVFALARCVRSVD